MTVSENGRKFEDRFKELNRPGVRISKRRRRESSFLVKKRDFSWPLGPLGHVTFFRSNNASQVMVTIRPNHVVTIAVLGGLLYSLLCTMIPALLATGDFLPILVSLFFLFLVYVMYMLSFDKIADQLEKQISVALKDLTRK